MKRVVFSVFIFAAIILSVALFAPGCSETNGNNGNPPDTTDTPDTTEGIRPDSTGPGELELQATFNVIGNGVSQGLALYDNVLYVGDGQKIRGIDVSNPGSPSQLSYFPTTTYDYVTGLAVQGNNLYALYGDVLRIYDISNPIAPLDVGGVELPGNGRDIDLFGDYAFVGRIGSGVAVVDISTSSAPEEINTYFSYPAYSLTIGAGRLYTAGQTGYLASQLNISEPESVFSISQTYPPGETAFDMDYIYEHLFIAAGKTSLSRNDGIFTIHSKNYLNDVFADTTDYVCQGVSVEGNFAFVIDASTSGDSKLYMYFAYNPANTYLAESISLTNEAVAVLAEGNYIYVLCRTSLLIYRHDLIT